MDHFELDDILLAVKGRNQKNIVPYSFWKHFPRRDLRSEDLVQAHLEFQELVKSDIIKISPHSKFALVDFGVVFDEKNYNKETGSYITKKYPIKQVSDWEKIDEFDPQTGELGKQLEVVKGVTNEFRNTPAMMTVFLPTMVARKLVQDDKLLEHFNLDKQLVSDRLQVITNVMTEFSKICIELGSKGLFLATQEADANDGWNPEQWKSYAYPYDKQVLNNLRTKSDFQVLHLHGDKIFFKEVLSLLPVDAINFHRFAKFEDFFSNLMMEKTFSGGLLGGLEDKDFKNQETNGFPQRNFTSRISNKLSKRLIVAPGCVLSQNISNSEIRDMITKIR
jgi:uroporphyrinogen-III decarboxylase